MSNYFAVPPELLLIAKFGLTKKTEVTVNGLFYRNIHYALFRSKN